MGAEWDILLRAPELGGYARSKNRHDKSLDTVMFYIFMLAISTCDLHTQQNITKVRFFTCRKWVPTYSTKVSFGPPWLFETKKYS